MNDRLNVSNPLPGSDLLLQGLSRPHILLITDSDNTVSLTDKLICETSAQVTTAKNSKDATACCLRETFSVILCDIEMVSQEGVKVADIVVNNDLTRNTPIIFLDEIPESDYLRFSRHKSVPIDYVSMPINPHILISKVNVFLSLQSQRLAMVRMEEDLEQVSLYYKQILDSAAIGILYLDATGQINFLNPAAQALLQSDGCLIGTSVIPVLDGPRAKESRWDHHAVRESCLKGVEIHSGDALFYRPDTSTFPAEYTFSPMAPESGFPGGVLIFRDITEPMGAEHRLHTVADEDAHSSTSDAVSVSANMGGIARLSAVLAHDFNNILAIILGNLELLDYEDIDNSKVQSRLASIQKSAERACSLTTQLLGISRRKAEKLVVSNASEALEKMNQIILAELPSNVTLTLNLHESLWPTSIDPDDFQESVLNLIANAREAMPDGGGVTLGTTNTIIDKAYCSLNPDMVPGDYVEVTVTDSGRGIATDAIPFVFEPFFSTKDESRRTGIGLALVYGFCQRSNGYIRLQSSPEAGTTVRLYLPRSTHLQPDT